MKWEDCSLWAKGEDRTEPKSVQVQTPLGPLIVSRHQWYAPTDWRITFDAFELIVRGNRSLAEAKKLALKFARKLVKETASALKD